MIVVTGGAGFIGSNLVKVLNERGRRDVLVVDNPRESARRGNLADCRILDCLDQDRFLARVKAGADFSERVEAMLHQGACTTTTERDERFMLRNNYDYTRHLLAYCLERRIPFLYASSAAVYGAGERFTEGRANEAPLNAYARSKLEVDRHVRRLLRTARSQVVGLRYFNVYGPRERHKGPMASMVFQLREQLLSTGRLRLFEGSGGYGPGEQRRDFVYVGDVAEVNLWMLEHRRVSGVFNLGTGRSRSFNDVARAVIHAEGRGGVIDYIPFPAHLRGRYQSFTEADIRALRAAGYARPFLDVEAGVRAYLKWLRRLRE